MLPQVAKVTKAEKENSIVTTLTLGLKLQATPGQFVMLWLPGFDEKPYSIAGVSPLTISVGARGPFSNRLCQLEKGDKVWVRGPFGRGFELKGKSIQRAMCVFRRKTHQTSSRCSMPKPSVSPTAPQLAILLVGGGYGFAPLRYLASEAKKGKIPANAICGARSKGLLMKPAACKTIFTTDDGSAGLKGNVITGMQELFKGQKFDMVYTCGPEKMMGAVAREAKKRGAGCQLLLERYMKCGIGVCGHCACGGKLACIDGPRFGYEILGNPEFEKVWRDKAGKKVPI